MNFVKCKADNGFIHALTDLFYSAHLHEHSEKLSSYSVVKISSNKLTKWSFTAHSALWLCSGYLLYVFTLGKHIVYYSHSIHILYICMYTFLLSSRKVSRHFFQDSFGQITDYTAAISFFIVIKNKLLYLWEPGDVGILLNSSHILAIPPEPDCEMQTISSPFCRVPGVSSCLLGQVLECT